MLSVIEIYSFLYFIFYQLFLFVFKLLGPLLLKVKPKWQAQVAQGIIKEDLSTTMQVDALPCVGVTTEDNTGLKYTFMDLNVGFSE